MLQHAGKEGPLLQALAVGDGLHEHVDKVHRVMADAVEHEGDHAARKDEALGAATEVVHAADAGRRALDGDAAGGEVEADDEGVGDEEERGEGGVAEGFLEAAGAGAGGDEAGGEAGDTDEAGEQVGWRFFSVPAEIGFGVEEAQVEPLGFIALGGDAGINGARSVKGAGEPAINGEDVAFDHGDVGRASVVAGLEQVGIVEKGFGLVVASAFPCGELMGQSGVVCGIGKKGVGKVVDPGFAINWMNGGIGMGNEEHQVKVGSLTRSEAGQKRANRGANVLLLRARDRGHADA